MNDFITIENLGYLIPALGFVLLVLYFKKQKSGSKRASYIFIFLSILSVAIVLGFVFPLIQQ